MITPTEHRTFKPALPTPADFEAAELEAKRLAEQLALPDGFSIYACTARFFSWAESDSREWFQLRAPSGGETTFDRAELLKMYPLDSR